ncbi:MAG: cobalamin-dependent protein [Deltaproteobacteria bacterium]|jgi:methylmalonyl-CoA mutase cobalamin-binding domain/chain|nr:cobalamin-dependent protein [Deltaproteobacteria bacterium]
MADYEQMLQAMIELDEEALIEMAEAIMAEGGAQAIDLMKACQEGMEEVGRRFEAEEYFIGDLVCAGDMMGNVMKIVRPALAAGADKKIGTMIMATVKGDMHDIGKNIVKALLEAAGFEIVDLGIDVEPTIIVETAKEKNINIVGLSCVLTLAIDSMKQTVQAFQAAGLREGIHIIIGGNPVSEEVKAFTGADAWAINPQDTIRTCRAWAGA